MRIISGKYKGRNIKGYTLKGTRPTISRVKESLFAMINDKLLDSTCLDLFAGSGNLGIEALSNGARFTVFNDKEKLAVKTIKDNLLDLKISNASVSNKDFKKFLQSTKLTFDIIFLDPPYESDFIKEALELIEEYKLLKKNGIIVLETSDVKRLIYSDYYSLVKEKKYSDKIVRIIKTSK